MPTEILLVADDDRLILHTMAQGLRRAGYTVIESDSGKNTIDLCQEITPDLAILDMRMKDLSGLDVANWLNANKPTPFIFLSAYDDHDTVQAATSAGALGYMVKPVSVLQLLPSIRAALARAADIRKLRATEIQLNQAISSSRELSIAIGILMERLNVDQQEAFEILRKSAREQRRKAMEIAVEIIQGKIVA